MGYFTIPEIDYSQYSNRELATIPIAVLALALLVLTGSYLLFGTPVSLGIEFAGGTEMTVQTATAEADIPAAFDSEVTDVQEIDVGENQYILQFTDADAAGLSDQAESNLQQDGDADVVQSASATSASFGAETRTTALIGLAVAFTGMSLIAFLLFRTFVPSIAIVVSAFSDIMIPLAFMAIVGIDLTLGTVAALLLLIGYSVDSDILLNNHILRRSGDFYESTAVAMRTGVTMTLTSMVAMLVMAISAFLFGIELLSAIGTILFIGLAADLMNTYLLNLSLLRWYVFSGVTR